MKMKKPKSDTIKKRNGKNTVLNTYMGKFEHEFNKQWTEKEIQAIGDELFTWINKDTNLWIKDFCYEKMLSRQRISEFKKRSEYFNWIYELIQAKQESKLLHAGMKPNCNTAMIIFALKHNHKWNDKPETNDFPEDLELLLKMTGIAMQQNI